VPYNYISLITTVQALERVSKKELRRIMVADTYQEFILLYDIPYTAVVILYLLLKYVAITAVLLQRSKCCSKCCGCWTKVEKLWRKYSSWLVRIVFGGTEGVSENNRTLDADEHGIGKVYIRGNQVEKGNLDLLGAITSCFFLLLFLTMYSTYLLEATFQCSDNPAIYCFERPDDDSSTNPRITNCSVFEDTDTSSSNEVQCFRYAFNAKEALAVGGGLLAIFTISMRFLISAFSNACNKLSSCTCCSSSARKVLQYALFLILTVFNFIATIVVCTLVLASRLDSLESSNAPVAEETAAYLADNGVQFIIITSTVELLLLIDWDTFQQCRRPNGTLAMELSTKEKELV